VVRGLRPGPIRRISRVGPGGDSPTLWDHAWTEVDLDYELARFREERDPIGREISRWTKSGDRVLEAGCGSGRLLDMLLDAERAGVGVDFAAGALSQAKARRPYLPMIAADVNKTPFRDGTFDAVTSLGLVEHFQGGPDAVLREHRRVLRRGGILILTVPRISPLKTVLDCRLVGRTDSYVSAMGRQVQRVWETEAMSEQGAASAFYQYEFRDSDLMQIVSAAGFIPLHVHAIGIAFGLREVPALGRIIRGAHDRAGRSHQRRSDAEARLSQTLPAIPSTVRDLLGSEIAGSWWARPLLLFLRRLFGHVLLIVAQAA
jgi:SAM-dependent methyltransferase